ncbi:unknown [Clostridium sp. CAG:349]|nr:unknown [Clostridium sp. CAG:349]
MVFFLLCLCVFVSFFAIAVSVSGYLSVDRECMIFVVKIFGVKAFKIIVQKINGIFEITINGQIFDKKPKNSQRNLNLRKLIAIKKITLMINSDGDEFLTAMIKGAVKALNIKDVNVKIIQGKQGKTNAYFDVKARVSIIKGVIYGH